MLSTETFNNNNIQTIKSSTKALRVYVFIFFVVLIPLSFLLGLIGLLKKGHGYWPTTIGLLIFFSLSFLYAIIKEYLRIKKDIKSQLKYVGIISVLRKSKKRNDYIVYTDSKDLKSINVLFAKVFDKIDVGDNLYVEQSKYSKYLFMLVKDGVNLHNGG